MVAFGGSVGTTRTTLRRPVPETAWLILPTFDEAENVEAIVRAASSVLAGACGEDGYRVLVVDDSSPDGTGEIVARMGRDDPRVEVLVRPERQGLGPAYLAGFAYALARDATYLFEMDADFSHDPADL